MRLTNFDKKYAMFGGLGGKNILDKCVCYVVKKKSRHARRD